jgi:hypothetical protein
MIASAWNVLEHSRVFSAHVSLCMMMVPPGKSSGDATDVSLWVRCIGFSQSQSSTWREDSSEKNLCPTFKFNLIQPKVLFCLAEVLPTIRRLIAFNPIGPQGRACRVQEP